jgi:hypothetical protein
MSQHAFAGISFGDPDREKIFDFRREALCDKWIPHSLEIADATMELYQNLVGDLIVKGQLRGNFAAASLLPTARLRWWAANPPTYGQSYAGSGLPYPNEDVAFEGTPNNGICQVEGGSFNFMMVYPNSYYTNLGTKYVAPEVKIQIVDANGKELTPISSIPLGSGIPFRTLTFPTQRNWNKGPLFYCNQNLPVRSQEQILRDSSYPALNKVPNNFWGTMPTY